MKAHSHPSQRTSVFWGLLLVVLPVVAFMIGTLYGAAPIAPDDLAVPATETSSPVVPFGKIGSDGVVTLMPTVGTLPDFAAPVEPTLPTGVNTPFTVGILAFALALMLSLITVSIGYLSAYMNLRVGETGERAQVVDLHEMRHLRARRRMGLGVGHAHVGHEHHHGHGRMAA